MGRKFFILTAAIVLAVAAYIMINSLGLDDSLDFGAGAYYYADMPGFEKWFDRNFYVSQVPSWLIMILFFAWGVAVYRLWLFIDRKKY